MAVPDNPQDLHHYLRPDMNTFIVTYPEKLLYDRGSTFVNGQFVTPEQARELQAAQREVEEAQRRAGEDLHDVRDLPAWEDYFDVVCGINDDRRQSYGRWNNNIGGDDRIDVPTDWLYENLEVDHLGTDETGADVDRLVTHQIITAEQLAVSGAFVAFSPRPDR